MTFEIEEDFPSLKDNWISFEYDSHALKLHYGTALYAEHEMDDGIISLSFAKMKKHCIDKQKVRDVLNNYDDHDEIVLDDLKRELGVK